MKKSHLRKIIREEIQRLTEGKATNEGEGFFNEHYRDIIKVFKKYPEKKWHEKPTYAKIDKIVRLFTKNVVDGKNVSEVVYNSAWEYFTQEVIPNHKDPTYTGFMHYIYR